MNELELMHFDDILLIELSQLFEIVLKIQFMVIELIELLIE